MEKLHYLGMRTIVNWWIHEMIAGPDHLDVATMLNNIGSVYAEERSDEKAMEYYLEALKVSHYLHVIFFSYFGIQFFKKFLVPCLKSV